MASLRLYKDFYCISSDSSLSADTYTLIDPVSLTAEVFVEGGSTIIESPSVIRESLGKYYVHLSPNLYGIDDNYEVKWNVVYVSGAPSKILISRFRLNPFVIGHEIEIRLENQNIRL